MDFLLWWIVVLFIPIADYASSRHIRRKRVIYRDVCFKGVGCFNNSSPFDNAAGFLPDSPDVVNPKFLLLTRKNIGVPDLLLYNDTVRLKASYFDSTKPVVFIIHGFAQSGAADWVKPMADAILEKRDCSVVVVDWGPGAKFPHYLQATANSRLVGRLINILIQRMSEIGAHPENMHLIGHSLGAHIAGYAGTGLRSKLGQITGLDPADPLFGGGPEVRLDRSDANFVGIIHTNGVPIYLGGYGMYEDVGHADFYINGGHEQPGCSMSVNSLLRDIIKGKIKVAESSITCSHSRAHDIYLESIKSAACVFRAFKCNNTDDFNAGRCLSCDEHRCAKMGYHVNTTRARGKYFMKTRQRYPYCGLHYGLTIDTAAGGRTRGRIIVTFIGADGNVSEPLQLFREDATLRPGHPHEYVVVVSHEVDDIAEIEVTYKKHTSWIFWTNGSEKWLPEYILITPGGKVHREAKWFCLKGMAIKSGKPTRIKHDKGPCRFRNK